MARQYVDYICEKKREAIFANRADGYPQESSERVASVAV